LNIVVDLSAITKEPCENQPNTQTSSALVLKVGNKLRKTETSFNQDRSITNSFNEDWVLTQKEGKSHHNSPDKSNCLNILGEIGPSPEAFNEGLIVISDNFGLNIDTFSE